MEVYNPINLSLKQVLSLFQSSPIPPISFETGISVSAEKQEEKVERQCQGFTDNSADSLDKLVQGALSSNDILVLIRMNNEESKKNQPYADLLEQIIKEYHLGVSESIDLVATNLLKSYSDTKIHQLPDSIKLIPSPTVSNIKIDTIDTSEDRTNSIANLINWAKLESTLMTPKTPFSRLAGGIRPLIYIFDDYTNFINKEPKQDEVYNLVTAEVTPEVKEFYQRSSSSQSEKLDREKLDCEKLDRVIKGFCRCLNNLSLAFEIKTPNMEFPLDPNADLDKNLNYFEQIAKILNFKELDKNHNQIGAFIIDLEWLPSPKWIEQHPRATFDSPPDSQQMGHYAVRLLTQRYPEIPCFIFTGLWSIETLQQSLTAGAAWCFQKPLTHHLGSGSHPSEELNYFNLERHLTEFAKRTYGTYEQLPKPDRFNTHPSTLFNKLAHQSENPPSDARTSPQCTAEDFHHLIARSFTADRVEVVRVIGSGKSGAAATFFVSPTSDRLTEATRFVKIVNWLEIQKEYAAYQQIIKPKLNNHIARIIQPPAVIPNQQTNSSQIDRSNATIVSSLAGFPENYDKLRPLQEIFNNHIGEPKGAKEILPFICETIEYVLLPLQLPTKQKDFYFGEIAPSLYTGELIELKEIDIDNRKIVSGKDSTLKLHIKIEAGKTIYLQDWILTQIKYKEDKIKNPEEKVDLVLAHPILKARIKLKGNKADIQKRFGALWLKLGMSISLDIKVDSPEAVKLSKSKDLNDICSKHLRSSSDGTVENLTSLINIWNSINPDGISIEGPFDRLTQPDEIANQQLKGSFGGIHGDLNLNNILYPKEEKVGFLIDFSESELEGLAAFDLAWLESLIWNFYLFPNLIELAKYSSSSSSKIDAEKICEILQIALEAMNCCAYPADFFIAKTKNPDRHTSKQLLTKICNALTIASEVRQYFTRKTSISFQGNDVHYALAMSFLRQSSFTIESPNPVQRCELTSELTSILSYLCSAHYLKVTTSYLKMSDISPIVAAK